MIKDLKRGSLQKITHSINIKICQFLECKFYYQQKNYISRGKSISCVSLFGFCWLGPLFDFPMQYKMLATVLQYKLKPMQEMMQKLLPKLKQIFKSIKNKD